MERVIEDLSRFSLSGKEADRIKVSKKKQGNRTNEVTLAAKFLNRRVLNVKVVGCTFKAIWKTRKSFDIREVGDHILLFIFEAANDAERVIRNEPWSFDKHLVLFKRLDSTKNIRSLNFSTTSFWVQLHGLPMDHLDISTALTIGETIGPVSSSEQETEMIGGDFLRVRVEVDVTKPLCRGRKVLINDEEEAWVSFKYEKLSNFCYWCGLVNHDDKDCDIWLSNKGSLPKESQEFGSWLRANPFLTGRKTYCSVPGMDSAQHEGHRPPPPKPVAIGTTATPPSSVPNPNRSGLTLHNREGDPPDLMGFNANYSHPIIAAPKRSYQFKASEDASFFDKDPFERELAEVDLELNSFEQVTVTNMEGNNEDNHGKKVGGHDEKDHLTKTLNTSNSLQLPNKPAPTPTISTTSLATPLTIPTLSSTTSTTSSKKPATSLKNPATSLNKTATSQPNPKPRRLRQLARLIHVDDPTMQRTVSRKRIGEECELEISIVPSKKSPLLDNKIISQTSMVEAARQPRQEQ